MKRLISFYRPYLAGFGGSLLLSAGSLLSALGLLATSGWLISEASTRPPVLTLEVAIVAVRTFGLSRGLLKYVSRIIEHDAALHIQSDLRSSIYSNIRGISWINFSSLRRGQFMQQIVHDVDSTQDLWLRIWNPWFSALLTGVAGIGILNYLLPSYSIVVSILFAITLASAPLLSYLSRSSADIRIAESELFEKVVQSFSSVDESKVFGYQAELIQGVHRHQSDIESQQNRSARWSGVTTSLHSTSLGISCISGILFASNAYAHGHLAGINVAVVIFLPLAIFDGASTLPAAFSRIQHVIDASRAIEPYLATVEVKPSLSAPQGVHLKVEQLTPVIPGKRLPAFNGSASPGNPWIIQGISGYGKSSLIYSLLGFISHTGKIYLDENEIESLGATNSSTLLQDDYLFSTNIRENLKIGNSNASDLEILSILKIVELDSLINTLPAGLDTLIGESGYNFSGGEKQRLKIARVLLRESSIYLLDEPFEYLGINQASRIRSRVLERLSNKTVVLISHLEL